MRKRIAMAVAVVLFVTGLCVMMLAYKNQVLFRDSHGVVSLPIDLDRLGTLTAQADPPGRSFFRPGGLLEVVVEGPHATEDILQDGEASVRVTDRAGNVCLAEDSSSWTMWRSRAGTVSIAPSREFDTSAGGPYKIRLEVTKPFARMAGKAQSLRVRHFVCGNEVILHWSQYAGSTLLFAAGAFVTCRARTCAGC
jgi:hypothetical protein